MELRVERQSSVLPPGAGSVAALLFGALMAPACLLLLLLLVMATLSLAAAVIIMAFCRHLLRRGVVIRFPALLLRLLSLLRLRL